MPRVTARTYGSQESRRKERNPIVAFLRSAALMFCCLAGLYGPRSAAAQSCTPTTTALEFDGGYEVSMCYRTAAGQVGQAKSGVWASGQAGILWFFDRGNAEVLVKVLDGCAHNNHRWVFVAPVTDIEFNLWVTGPNGRRWTHTNRQKQTASAKSDTSAFPCSDSGTGETVPDLTVTSASVSNRSPSTGGRFTLRATVRNQGAGRSASTTLRYYRSSNSTISTSDRQVGTDAVSALSPSGSSAESISLTAPSSAGTYYYGACVDAVSGESSTRNNCSQGVRVTVADSGGTGGAGSINLTECRGQEVSSGRFDITIRGTARLNAPYTGVTATGYVEPIRRRVGSQSLGSFRANQTKSFNITGTVSGVRPTRCVVEVRGSRGTAAFQVLRGSAPLEEEERKP